MILRALKYISLLWKATTFTQNTNRVSTPPVRYLGDMKNIIIVLIMA